MSSELLSILHSALTLRTSLLVGCHRRNLWDTSSPSSHPPQWRNLRGNALLALLGEKVTIPTPLDTLEVYLRGPFLLFFRGGEWASHWLEDITSIWSLASISIPSLSRTTYVLVENKGSLSIHLLPIPPDIIPLTHLASLLSSFEAEGRISKAGPRAIRTCPYCPHKRRCDALDKLHSATSDWSPHYPFP